MLMKQSAAPPPIRLSYRLLTSSGVEGSTRPPMLRISVAYASGRTNCLPEQFSDTARVERYLKRFYPDLVGKCTAIETQPIT